MQAVLVEIKLKPGWALDPLGSAFRHGARRVPLLLGTGMRVEPLMPLYPEPEPTEAEREIARYVNLHHPGPVDEALALAWSWPCVDRVALR